VSGNKLIYASFPVETTGIVSPSSLTSFSEIPKVSKSSIVFEAFH